MKNLCMCFVDLEKTFDRIPWKVLEWAMGKNEIPEILVIQQVDVHIWLY